jgi:hypothetical protein
VVGAFLLGVAVESVGGFGIGVGGHADDPRDFESPGFTVAKGTGPCDGPESDSGWVHDVAVGESFAVTLEAVVVHD